MNALMAVVKPGELDFDVMHYNLHKTFSTPHGGGGPGSGAVGVNEKLKDYLPGPIVDIIEEEDESGAPLYGYVMPNKSIGRIKAFQGNFGMHLRAYAYIRVYGDTGIRDVTRFAVLNANYLRAKLMKTYKLPYPRYCGHEFVLEGHFDDVDEVHALDISKRLMDYGFHPPTNYFPLIVPEALLIEPTETEVKEDLDAFVEAMESIAEEARSQPELLLNAPHTAPVRRLDEVKSGQGAHTLLRGCAAGGGGLSIAARSAFGIPISNFSMVALQPMPPWVSIFGISCLVVPLVVLGYCATTLTNERVPSSRRSHSITKRCCCRNGTGLEFCGHLSLYSPQISNLRSSSSMPPGTTTGAHP